MSEGPIKRERDAWKPPIISNAKKAGTVHAPGDGMYSECGRRGSAIIISIRGGVTCSDCIAAERADAASAPEPLEGK